jgi:hypothetical protein
MKAIKIIALLAFLGLTQKEMEINKISELSPLIKVN